MLEQLSKHLDKEVIKFLEKDAHIKNLLADWLLLIDSIRGKAFTQDIVYGSTGRILGRDSENLSNLFNDYSFLVAPAYKAFEGYLYLLAEKLGVKTKEELDKTVNIGSCYNIEEIEKLKMEIISETGKKIDKNDREDMGKISELKRVLELYRHSPAHYGGERIDTFEKAENYGRTIIVTINETTKYFIKNGFLNQQG